LSERGVDCMMGSLLRFKEVSGYKELEMSSWPREYWLIRSER
jgi:hypothetical protein